LTQIADALKKFESENSLITDLVSEIENQIYMSTTQMEQEREVKKIMGKSDETPDISKKGYTYATYNKYEENEDDENVTRMTRKWLDKFLCSNFRLYYRTHELNECLYLHFKGFRQIENLDTFINMKVLYLEGNSIKRIQGLEKLVNLSSLYLHQNMIEKIEGLETLINLYNLNLSDNCITKIENLKSLEKLSNLLLKGNRIGIDGMSDLEGLKELSPTVSVVDISYNKIDEVNIIENILVHLPSIKVLYLQGNECVRKISHYRKTLISSLKNLTYLDDKPVFEDERRFAEAFTRGGLEEEKKERALFRKEKEEAELQRIQDFRDMIENWKKGGSEEQNTSDLNKEAIIKTEKEIEEDRKNKLLKLKNRNNLDDNPPTKSNIVIQEEIIDTNIFSNIEIVNSNNPKDTDKEDDSIIDHNYQLKYTNAEENDLPDLETIKRLKEEGYIEHVLEKEKFFQENIYEDVTQIREEEKEDKQEVKPGIEENIVTSHNKIDNNITENFNELD
jgi:hypothetical protein